MPPEKGSRILLLPHPPSMDFPSSTTSNITGLDDDDDDDDDDDEVMLNVLRCQLIY